MLEIASQMILWLLLSTLFGFIIGYLFGKSICNEDNCTEDQEENKEIPIQSPITTAPKNGKPLLLLEPRNGEKDNLTRIKGIGVKINETLNTIGIYHFDQIASWNKENITWVDTNVAFPGRVNREQWVEQALALAAGKETEFSKRVDEGKVSSSKK